MDRERERERERDKEKARDKEKDRVRDTDRHSERTPEKKREVSPTKQKDEASKPPPQSSSSSSQQPPTSAQNPEESPESKEAAMEATYKAFTENGVYDESLVPEVDPTDKQPSEAAITTTFKKRGHFDNYRKQFFSEFEKSEEAQKFLTELKDFMQKELERDPEFYDKDSTAKTASLLEGAVERSDVYRTIENAVDKFLAEHKNEMGMTVFNIWSEMFEDINGRKPYELKDKEKGGKTGEGEDKDGDVKMEDGDGVKKENEQLTLSGLRGASESSISPVVEEGTPRRPGEVKVY